jgi:protein-tyrosine phosphatase
VSQYRGPVVTPHQTPSAPVNPVGAPHGPAPSWPLGRSLHGGVDEVPLPDGVPGRLWLCGKRYVAPDPEAAMANVGATMVACLCEPGELAERYPGYAPWLRANQPRRALWHPIADLHAPTLTEALELWEALRARLGAGEGVVLHCGAGIGRAGTVAAGLLVTLGRSPAEAVAHVAAHRPTAGPEVGAQSALLEALVAHLREATATEPLAPAEGTKVDRVHGPGHHLRP